jgi:hypothetical protein
MTQNVTVKDLEDDVNRASATVAATEKLVMDLEIEASLTLNPQATRRLETKIARFTYRLAQEKLSFLEP